MKDVIFWMNAVGLACGLCGAVGLALLTRGFIRTNDDGTQLWGPPKNIPNDDWKRSNLRFRTLQRIGIPMSYSGLGVGFVLQLIALVLARLQ